MKKESKLSLLASLLILIMGSVIITSCEDDDGPELKAEIVSFEIVNAGVDGDQKVEGEIDDFSITVFVPFETDVTELVPEIELTEGASVTPSSGEPLDFSEPRNFVVENEDIQNTYEVEVVKQDPDAPVLKSMDVISVTTEESYETDIDYSEDLVTVSYNELQSDIIVLDEVEVGPEGATYTTSSGSDTLDLSEEPTLTVEYTEESKEYSFAVNKTEAGMDPETVTTLADRSAASQEVPDEISDENSRGAAFNGEHVFIPSRYSGDAVYYWDVNEGADAMNELQGMDNISDGSWAVSDVQTVGDAIYVSNMVMEDGQVFKVYKWDNVDDDNPEVVLEYTIQGDEERLGDAISIVGDPEENGFIASTNFPVPEAGGEADNNKFFVWKADGGELSEEPEIWDVQVDSEANLGQYGRISEIPGVDNRYIVTGAEMNIVIVDDNGDAIYEMPGGILDASTRMYDASVFEYNGGIYLSYTMNKEWEENGVYYEIVNISEGDDAVDGIMNLDEVNIDEKKIYTKNFSEDADKWIAAVNRVAYNDNDEPMVMAFSVLNGFIVESFSK